MRLAGDCSSPAITGSALEVQAVYREYKIPWCPGCGITAPLRRCNVWSIPSMEDGQGRALGSGSIPDASASPKGRKKRNRGTWLAICWLGVFACGKR